MSNTSGTPDHPQSAFSPESGDKETFSDASESDGTLICPNLPRTQEILEELTQRCRAHVNRRALYTTAGNFIPIPFADTAIDVGMLTGTLNYINEAFGLSEEEMEKLSSREQKALALLISNQGAEYAGKAVTKFLVTKMVSAQAGKVAGKQTAKYVPIIGQLVAGSISYATLRYMGMRHIAQCREIIQRARGWQTDSERKAALKQAKAKAKADAHAARQAEKAAAKQAKQQAKQQNHRPCNDGSDPPPHPTSANTPGILTELRLRAACIGRGFKQAFSKTAPPTEK